ncbi:hypothetical protein [Bartonella massiliensis]|nr:hypothetical protein [Bartonella massiliensis]
MRGAGVWYVRRGCGFVVWGARVGLGGRALMCGAWLPPMDLE